MLPKWDAYAMGYAPDGRGRFVADEHLGRAYGGRDTPGPGAGDGLPLILRGGLAVATWSHRFAGNRLRVEVEPFAPGVLPLDRCEAGFADVGRLLGAAGVEIALAASTA